MNKIFITIVLLFCINGYSQTKSIDISNQIVDASCGQCNFKMPGSGCTLAVKINDQPYYVSGVDIDDYGDAHAQDGFCLKVRKAKVTGVLKDEQFSVKNFELLPDEDNLKEVEK